MLYASIATITIFISCILSATLILFHRRKEASHLVWAGLSYTIGFWALGLCLTINAQTYETALFWGRFHNYLAILIIPLFVHFVYSLIGQKSRVVYWVYLYFCVLLALHLIFFEQFIPTVRPIGEFNFYIQAGSLYWIFLLSYFSLTTFGALRLAVALPKSSGLKKKQFTYVLVAFILGFSGGGTTFPMAYGLNIYPFGLGTIIVYVLLITYAIIQHRVFDVSALVANALSVMLTLLVLTGGYVFIWQMYLNFFTHRTNTADLVLNLLYLAFACESYFIVRPKLHALNKTLLAKRHYSYAEIRDSLAVFGEDLLEPQALMRQAHRLLRNDLKLPISHFFISKKLLQPGQTEAALVQWSSQKECFDSVDIPGLEQRLLRLTSHGINTSIDEADQELKSIMALLDAGIFLPFVSDAELLGLAFIAKRKGADLYTADDFLVFDLLSSKIKASLSRALAHLHSKNAVLSLAGSIAHEMRNPLSQIKASLHGIERALPIPAATQQITTLSIQQLKNLYQYVAVGESAIQRGSQVIAMILGEVAAKPVNTEHFSYLHAAQTTQKAIAEYGYETAGERDKIRIDVQRDFIFKGDETLTLFVLFNLIKNALYYFKLKPSATLTITINQPTITVRDTGPGIPTERLRHLFESFQTSGKQGGTGLGLAYCKRVMQAFGGNITCHTALGEFTEFTLHFPEVTQSTWIAYEQSIIAKARPIFKNKRILVVDDDESLRMMTQDILSDLGAQIDQAENGQVALEKLAQESYDLVVMDLNMPVLDGYAAAEKIRAGAVAGYEQIPIIAYTTESAYMAQVKTQKVGIHRFLSKPCEPLVLIQTLAQALIENSAENQETKNPSRTLSGKTILIADDGESNRDILKYHLHDWGATVLEAQHGAEVIAQLEANSHCHALLLDMRMPGMDGLAVTKTIRTTPSAYQAIPIIAVTGQTDEVDMIAAYQAGVDDCLSKPVDADVLHEKLHRQIDRLTVRTTLNAEQLSTAQKINPLLFDTPRLEACIARGLFKHGENSAYIRQTKEWLSILEASIQNKDFKKMQDALHFIKGSSANIGATALSQWVARIEKQTINGNWPSEEDWFEKTVMPPSR